MNFLLLDKEEVVRLSEDFLVFRLNLMNLIATQTQKQLLQLWRREELNDSRLNVSKALNQMQRDGLIELHRGRVVIHQLERLMF